MANSLHPVGFVGSDATCDVVARHTQKFLPPTPRLAGNLSDPGARAATEVRGGGVAAAPGRIEARSDDDAHVVNRVNDLITGQQDRQVMQGRAEVKAEQIAGL